MVGGGAGPDLRRWAVLAAVVAIAGVLAWQTVARRAPVEPVLAEVTTAPATQPQATEPVEVATTGAPTVPPPTTEPAPDPTSQVEVPAGRAESPDEVRATYNALHEASWRLLQDPSRADLDAIFATDCNCYDLYRRLIDRLTAEGHRVVGELAEVQDFSIRGATADGQGWDLEVVLTQPEQQELDAGGQLVTLRTEGPPVRLHVVISESDGMWKFALVGAIEELT